MAIAKAPAHTSAPAPSDNNPLTLEQVTAAITNFGQTINLIRLSSGHAYKAVLLANNVTLKKSVPGIETMQDAFDAFRRLEEAGLLTVDGNLDGDWKEAARVIIRVTPKGDQVARFLRGVWPEKPKQEPGIRGAGKKAPSPEEIEKSRIPAISPAQLHVLKLTFLGPCQPSALARNISSKFRIPLFHAEKQLSGLIELKFDGKPLVEIRRGDMLADPNAFPGEGVHLTDAGKRALFLLRETPSTGATYNLQG